MKQRIKNILAFSITGGSAWLVLSATQHFGGFWAAAALVATICATYVFFGPEE